MYLRFWDVHVREPIGLVDYGGLCDEIKAFTFDEVGLMEVEEWHERGAWVTWCTNSPREID